MVNMDTTYLIEDYVTTKSGDPYRLFPFGKVVKGGRVHDITPEYAATIKLPHFQPAIKLGSHEDTTPAGGHIRALEVRDDGLYAIPEWNEQGDNAMKNGAYKYHSPEILWEGAIEDPKTGAMINAPLIVGDALLHMPHLGEAAKLYSVEITQGETTMTDENVSVPKSLWDKFTALLEPRLTPPEPQRVEVVPDDYSAIKQERDELKAQAENRAQAEKFAALKSDLVGQLQGKENYGMAFVELKAADEAASVLSSMSDEQREWVMRNFRAFIAQADASKLLSEKGVEGQAIDDPKAAFNALVLKTSAEKNVNYNQAFELVKSENADLFASAFSRKEK